MSYSVYIITNTVNGKVYIGYTRDVKKRWRKHIALSKSKSSKRQRLHCSMSKHGIEAFRFDVLETDIPTIELAFERERMLIAEHNSYEDQTRGYNMTPGGEGGPTFLGRHHTDKWKHHMSEVQSNRSPEWQANFKRAQQNRSEEWRKNISIAQQNRGPVSEDGRQKMRDAWVRRKAEGRIITDEGRARISAAHKGRSNPQVTRDGVSDKRKLMLLQQDVEIFEGKLEVSERAMRRHMLRIETFYWDSFSFRSEAVESASSDLRSRLPRAGQDPA